MVDEAPRFSPEHRAAVRNHVARFATRDDRRAIWILLSTVATFAFGLALLPHATAWTMEQHRNLSAGVSGSVLGLAIGVLVTGALGLAVSGSYVRAFLVHHDLTHGAFFSNPKANRLGALLCGVVSSTSPTTWKREHDRHHKHSNDLDHDQDGQTASWTVEQYCRAPTVHRVLYRLANTPWVLFLIVPPFYFLAFMRLRARWYENLLQLAFYAVVWATGRSTFFLVTFVPAALFGFYVFHLQHTFDGVYKRRGADWDFFDNGMLGSSHLQLPTRGWWGKVLGYFTYGVQYHHIHHLNPGIPAYNLAACQSEGESLFRDCPRVSFWDGLRTASHSLYDEEAGCFRDVRSVRRPATPR